MKPVKLFEQFIVEFYSNYDKDEITAINKLVAKETGMKNADSTKYPSLLAATLFNGNEIRVLFDKIIKDAPATEDNTKVEYIDATSIVRYITTMHSEESKLMKQWAKKWGFKLDKSDQIYANKDILPKDTKKMIEEFIDILIKVYGEDDIKLAY